MICALFVLMSSPGKTHSRQVWVEYAARFCGDFYGFVPSLWLDLPRIEAKKSNKNINIFGRSRSARGFRETEYVVRTIVAIGVEG